MQQNIIYNNLFASPTDFKYFEINNFSKAANRENFINGLLNAHDIVKSLERSLQKTKKYEKKLLKCKTTHAHSHGGNEWRDDLSSDNRSESKCFRTGTKMKKSSRSQVDLTDSWSTMSLVCMQFQYEELSKRYNYLLQAYDERCSSLTSRNAALARLRRCAAVTHDRLMHAHRSLIMVGEKYLALRDRKIAQKHQYEEKLRRLKGTVREVMAAAERARMELDSHIASSLATESDSATSQLLAEIRKCNLLYLENLRLKAKVEELVMSTGLIND